jgi:Zn-dependent M28 family amino/carboxypeptidase
VGTVKGRSRRYVVVGAHYDTKDSPGFVGANDGASGTAVVTQLARQFARARTKPRHTLVFVLFDGEESPAGTADSQFVRKGLRGSKVAARRWSKADAMVLLDFVGDKRLSTPREAYSDKRLWGKLRVAARRVGVDRHFTGETFGAVSDDHLPFIRRGVRSIDLIDFDFPCWHKTCDDLSAVSRRSVDASGEAVRELIASL